MNGWINTFTLKRGGRQNKSDEAQLSLTAPAAVKITISGASNDRDLAIDDILA